MEIAIGILLGIGLAAAVGLRIFVPFLLVSIAANLGRVELDPSFAFLATKAALTTFTVATLLEVVAYHVPWVDHALDLVAGPAAAIGGALLAAATMVHLDSAVRWPLAIIAGGGVAGVVQMGTAALRVGSLTTTGGFGNPLLATAETGASVVLAFLALVLPLAIGLLLLPLLFVALRLRRMKSLRRG